jgi:peptide-methionine (S)-S-oxide reductase
MLKRFDDPAPWAAALALVAVLLAGAAAPVGAAPTPPAPPGMAKATFAGGCFWCMEGPFDRVPGVISTTSGYTGGTVKDPSYELVSSGSSGHVESVEVVYDPAKVSYPQLLDVFWHNVDPTDAGGQFCDRGNQYQTAIFYHDAEQRQAAEQSKKALEEAGTLKKKRIVTQIVAAGPFYAAEEYHQDYYKKNGFRYNFYRFNCGRDQRLKELWGSAPPH